MRPRRYPVLVAVVLMALILSTCGSTPAPTATTAPSTAAPTAVPPTSAPTKAPTAAPPTATKAPPTATAIPPTATPKGPTVGGKLVWWVTDDPDTLDPHTTTASSSNTALSLIGASLIILGPTNKYEPYLAESWKLSDDGLNFEFKIKKGVTFHDGSALTAKSFVYGLQRAKTKGRGWVPAALAPIDQLLAPDDYTLQIKLKQVNVPFLHQLNFDQMGPLPEAYTEKVGDGFGRNPVMAGPYMFKEWVTGSKLVLVRNPAFNWGPPFAHKGAPYIETIELKTIAESATASAGLESGELDLGVVYGSQDWVRLKATGKFQISESLWFGCPRYYVMNLDAEPFGDVRVRQAFNWALDKDMGVKAAYQGFAEVLYGPLSRSTMYYWPGVEKIAYGYDPARAKALLAEAGYKLGASGLLEKDGKPLKIKLITATLAEGTKGAEIMKENLKAINIDLEIQQVDVGVLIQTALTGQHQLAGFGMNFIEPDLLYNMFHSSQVNGGYNASHVRDPELDKMLEGTRTATDPAKRAQLFADIQKRIVEQAYIIPVAAPKIATVISDRVKGVLVGDNSLLYMFDAYIQTK
jgi:peptide/nickel transport system substrate-binding protein